jgi:photosystem II stability/assembly factor-like uncharacterized protein
MKSALLFGSRGILRAFSSALYLVLIVFGGCRDNGSPVANRQSGGPTVSQPFWKNVGLAGEDVTTVAASRDSIVIASINGRPGTRSLLYKSSDNGVTWSELPFREKCLMTMVDENHSLYTVTSNLYATDLHRSTDSGTTWQRVSIPRTNIVAICFDSAGATYLGDGGGDHSPGGVLRSTDGGRTWLYGDSISRIPIVSIAASERRVFAATRRGIYRTDDGRRWRLINAGMTYASGSSLVATAEGELFLGTYSSGLMKSTDEGETWQPSPVNGSVQAVASSPSNTLIAVHAVINGRDRISVSTISGQVWISDTTGLPARLSWPALVVTANGYVFVGSDSGVYRNVNPLR